MDAMKKSNNESNVLCKAVAIVFWIIGGLIFILCWLKEPIDPKITNLAVSALFIYVGILYMIQGRRKD